MLSKGRPAAQTVRVHGARLRELLAVRDGDEDDMRAAGSLGRVDGVDTLLILGLGVALPRFEEVRDEEQLLRTRLLQRLGQLQHIVCDHGLRADGRDLVAARRTPCGAVDVKAGIDERAAAFEATLAGGARDQDLVSRHHKLQCAASMRL